MKKLIIIVIAITWFFIFSASTIEVPRCKYSSQWKNIMECYKNDFDWGIYYVSDIDQVKDVITRFDEAIVLVKDGQIWIATKEIY